MDSVISQQNVRARTEHMSNEYVSNQQSDGATTNESMEEEEEEEEVLVEFEDTSSGADDRDNTEGLDANLSIENMTSGQSNGTMAKEPIEEEEEVLVESGKDSDTSCVQPAKELKDFEKGMKAQTNPDMACITFCDNNNVFVVCTNQKIKDFTTPVISRWLSDKKLLKDKNVIVVQGLDSPPFIPDIVIDASVLDPISMSVDDLNEALVTMAAEMAIPANQNIILACENAESFGKAASLYAALYLVFRNEGKLDVKQCMDAITHAFRQQCPSCFGENYRIPHIQNFYNALESIKEADRNTRFKTKTLEEIARNAHSNIMKLSSQGDVEHHSQGDLLRWNQNGPGAVDVDDIARSIHPFSSYLGQADTMARGTKKQQTTSLDCPDWLLKWWPDKNYHQIGLHGVYSPTGIAVSTANISACAFLLSKMGKDEFFNDFTNSKNATPLYHAASLGNVALVSWMLNNGGDSSLEKPDKNGRTPLFAACYNGHVEVVKILILHGAVASLPEMEEEDSTFEFLSLRAAEELRVWIKKLLDADICDPTMNSHLQSARNLILRRYLNISSEGDSQEIDLSSLDHGDHQFLKDETKDVQDVLVDDCYDLAVDDALEVTRSALLKQVDRRMYDLCTYNGTKRYSRYSRVLESLGVTN